MQKKKLEEEQSSFLPTTNGASTAGTVGWKAPEILRGDVKSNELSVGDNSISSRQGATTITTGCSSGTMTPTTKIHLTKSIDIFLGCHFYYIHTKGKHPYGDQANIIEDNKDLPSGSTKKHSTFACSIQTLAATSHQNTFCSSILLESNETLEFFCKRYQSACVKIRMQLQCWSVWKAMRSVFFSMIGVRTYVQSLLRTCAKLENTMETLYGTWWGFKE